MTARLSERQGQGQKRGTCNPRNHYLQKRKDRCSPEGTQPSAARPNTAPQGRDSTRPGAGEECRAAKSNTRPTIRISVAVLNGGTKAGGANNQEKAQYFALLNQVQNPLKSTVLSQIVGGAAESTESRPNGAATWPHDGPIEEVKVVGQGPLKDQWEPEGTARETALKQPPPLQATCYNRSIKPG